IENCKKELDYGEKSDCEEEEQILNNEGPILEQFLPLKRSNSSFEKLEQKITEEEKKIDEKTNLGMKVDWLKSVQLWNQNPDTPLKQDLVQNPTTKIELKKCGGGGAFQPFQSETKGKTNSVSRTPTTTTITTASIDMSNNTPSSVAATTSSTGDNNNSNGGNKRKRDEEKENELRRKTRRCWSPELHKRFLEALQQLGGSHVATPKQIKELMKVDGLTNDEVKSHLQKYRIHTRGGPSSAATHNGGNTQHQPPQFVVVGGIWVPPPPPEYTTTMADATIEAGTKRMNTNGMYVALSATSQQVAAASCSQQQEQQQHQSPTGSLHSEGRSKRGDHSSVDDVHSSSPTTSSSTETTNTTSLSKHVK
ncbi:hypothetical protein MKW94_030230, partial [Papaver nudicaule]|nr:hypothetical protein [Papaver nudicaule]